MKDYLRRRFKKRRARGSIRLHKKRSKQICLKLATYIKVSYPPNTNVLIYDPLPGEVNLFYLMHLLPNTNFFLPRVLSKKQMEAVPFTSIDQLVPHRFSTRSLPKNIKAIEPDNIQIVLIPGLAFSNQCERLGFGGGYYDRFLLNRNFKKIGVCFKNQIVKSNVIPMTKFDVFMDLVISG